VPAWSGVHGSAVWWAAGISAGSLIVGLAAVRVFVVRIPADYFEVGPRPAAPTVGPAAGRRPLHHALLRFGKNLLGCVLIAAGIAMLVLPGQGILTILVGVMLLDFPAKPRLQRWLVGRRPVLRTINGLRGRAGQAPLVLRR
jgi:hypothetical protein